MITIGSNYHFLEWIVTKSSIYSINCFFRREYYICYVQSDQPQERRIVHLRFCLRRLG